MLSWLVLLLLSPSARAAGDRLQMSYSEVGAWTTWQFSASLGLTLSVVALVWFMADRAGDDVERAPGDDDDDDDEHDDDEEEEASWREMMAKNRELNTRKGYARKYKHFRRFVVVNKRQRTLEDEPAQLDLSSVTQNELLGFLTHVQKKRSGGPFGPELEPKRFLLPARPPARPHVYVRGRARMYVVRVCMRVCMHAHGCTCMYVAVHVCKWP